MLLSPLRAMVEPSGVSLCLVCSAPCNSLHLGMDTCRACSAFFKRATSRGSRFPCRKGDGKCVNVKDAYQMCRGCRYDRCLEVGLVYDGPLRQRRIAQPTTLLQSFGTEYKALCERRRLGELQIAKSHSQRRVPHPTAEIYAAHVDTCYSIVYNSGMEIFTFFNNVFPTFKRVAGNDQMTIFKDYACKFSTFECYYRTRNLWKEDGDTFSMCSMVTCYDAETGLDGDTSKFDNLQFLASSFLAYIADQKALFLPLFNRIELTEQEKHGLMVLLLCESDSLDDLSEATIRQMDRYRVEILRDLQVYYRAELGLDDFSRRLGNLMTLNHTIQECKSLFKVFFRFFATIFDTCITQSLAKEMLQ